MRGQLSPLAAVASLFGAVLYGRRADDKKARAKAGALTAGTFVVFFAYQAVTFGQEWVRHEWKAADARHQEMLTAVTTLATDIRLLAAELRDEADRDGQFREAVIQACHVVRRVR